mgnify:CR=1 FL=1
MTEALSRGRRLRGLPPVIRLSAVVALAMTLGLSALGAAAPAHAQGSGGPPVTGQLVHVEGEVALLRRSGQAPAVVGTAVHRGDRISTGAAGRAEILFLDGARLRVGHDSMLHLTGARRGAAPRGGGLVRLFEGVVRMVIDAGRPSAHAVATPTAIAAARSTAWLVLAERDTSAVFVSAGKVEVRGLAGGASVVLAQGEGTDVPAGQPPQPPKRWGQKRIDAALARLGLGPVPERR